MKSASQVLPAEMTVREALERVRGSEFRTWLVTDRRGVIGVLDRARLEREPAEGADRGLKRWWMRRRFRICIPTRGWMWRWSAWERTSSTFCRW
jgi:hypothetical protein